MNEKDVKRYYKKINTTFVGVNKQDEFAKIFINLLKSGNTTLYQKERRERRIFDDSWMDSVEGTIPVIDRLTRHPRENLKKVSSVVPVELAKKVDKDSVRHLAQNTFLIKAIEADGTVTPSKILTHYNEADLGTYENRFLRSLIDKLYLFIEKRYEVIVKKMHTEYINQLNLKSEVLWNEATIEFDINLRINQTMPRDEIDRRNQELFDRMSEIRTSITNFKLSSFMTQMRQFAPVTPPIMKTNIITKNPDFRMCYYLWVLMDQVDRIGYDVDVFERDIPFEDAYLSQIENMLMVMYATVANNLEDDYLVTQETPFEYRKSKRPKIRKTDPNDSTLTPGYVGFENNEINQFYLDQIKSHNIGRFKTLQEAGISVDDAIDIIFKQINLITNAVYEDYVKYMYQTENAETLEEKIAIQGKILEVYRLIEKIKREDMRQFSTNKAIALLNLRNFQDELNENKRQEKAAKKKILDEQQKAREAQKQKTLDAEKSKKEQVERAKKVLEAAEKARKEMKPKQPSKKTKAKKSF